MTVQKAMGKDGVHARVAFDAVLSTGGECTGDAIFIGALVTLPLVAMSIRLLMMAPEPLPTVPESELSPAPEEPRPEFPSPKPGDEPAAPAPPPKPPFDPLRDTDPAPTQASPKGDPADPNWGSPQANPWGRYPNVKPAPRSPIDTTGDPNNPNKPPEMRGPLNNEGLPDDFLADRERQAVQDYVEASKKAREAESKWWADRQAADAEGRPRPDAPAELDKLAADAETKARTVDDIRELRRLGEMNQQPPGPGRIGDTQIQGRAPAPAPTPAPARTAAPAPVCPPACDPGIAFDKTQPQISPQLSPNKTLTGLGGSVPKQ